MKTALIFGSVAAIAASGLALAMWIANGIVYCSLVGLRGREHDLAIAHERAMIALAALGVLQLVAMLTTASWLPRGQLSGAVGAALRFVLALVISGAGAGAVLIVTLQISRWVH